jgi:hypothetical protein
MEQMNLEDESDGDEQVKALVERVRFETKTADGRTFL